MKQYFSGKQYAFLGVIASISFVLAITLGTAVNIATGTPLTGGILNGIIIGVIMTIGVKTLDKFGAAIVIWFVFSILTIPTVTLGPPGIQKIGIGLFIAIIWEICIIVFNRKRIGYIVGGGSMGITSMIGTYLAMLMLNMPGIEALQGALILLMLIYVPFGAGSAYLGLRIYEKKLQNLTVIKNFKEN